MDENKDKDFRYENENKELDMIKEEALAYGVKRQGEYTLEDYYALPEDVRVELIDGVVYEMETPTTEHQMILGEIIFELMNYIQKEGMFMFCVHRVGVQLNCDERTMVEPDLIMVNDREKIFNRCIYGAPDFVLEIFLPSSLEIDSTIKLRKYKAAGVKEYWMVDPDKQKVIVYDWANSDTPKIYGFDAKVPVGIFNGECEVDFVAIYEEIEFLYEKE